jgi:hypothetical protein
VDLELECKLRVRKLGEESTISITRLYFDEGPHNRPNQGSMQPASIIPFASEHHGSLPKWQVTLACLHAWWAAEEPLLRDLLHIAHRLLYLSNKRRVRP